MVIKRTENRFKHIKEKKILKNLADRQVKKDKKKTTRSDGAADEGKGRDEVRQAGG